MKKQKSLRMMLGQDFEHNPTLIAMLLVRARIPFYAMAVGSLEVYGCNKNYEQY